MNRSCNEVENFVGKSVCRIAVAHVYEVVTRGENTR